MKKILIASLIFILVCCIAGCSSSTLTSADALYNDAAQKNNIKILSGNPQKGEYADLIHKYFDAVMDIKMTRYSKDKPPMFLFDVSSKVINEQWTANMLNTFEKFIKESNLAKRGDGAWSLEIYAQDKDLLDYSGVATFSVLVVNEKLYSHLYLSGLYFSDDESEKYFTQPYGQNAFFKGIDVNEDEYTKQLEVFFDINDPKYQSIFKK